MNLQLGINMGFAINKYVEPEEWTRICTADTDTSDCLIKPSAISFV